MAKNRKQTTLHIIATDVNVREVEPDGQVLPGVRIAGKAVDHENQEAHIIPQGVLVPYSAYYINELKEGRLLPGSRETAMKAGVPFSEVV